jgi:hypothetical protein
MFGGDLAMRSPSAKSGAWRIASAYLEDHLASLARLAPLIKGAIRARDVAVMATLPDLSDEYHPDEWLYLRQLSAFFKKNKDFSDRTRCTAAALESFEAAEQQCSETNARIFRFANMADVSEVPAEIQARNAQIERMKKFIARVLGPVDHFLNELPELVRFTGGATADRTRRQSLPFKKVNTPLCAPSEALPIIRLLAAQYGVTDGHARIQDYNRVVFVLKNWATYRTIAAEPTHALPVQLAVDTYWKRMLRRVGVILSSQTRNQEMARLGSLDPIAGFATLDLKQASDTLATNVVALLLPYEWYRILKWIRSPGYRLPGAKPGEERTYAKFSSMGNGATFVLETLIFAAACVAVGASNWTCYGDDIILDADKAEEVEQLLNFLGFTINRSKSYTSGPFRESCGSDWYQGQLVTPFYLRGTPKRRPDYNHVVNGLARLGWPGSHVWDLALQMVKKHGLQCIPYTDDTLTGVHVDPRLARARGLVRVVDGVETIHGSFVDASFGIRKNFGARSLMLWFFQAADESPLLGTLENGNYLPSRPSTYATWIRAQRSGPLNCGTQVTEIHGIYTRYRNGTGHYIPTISELPIYLWSWGEFLDDHGCVSRRNTGSRRKAKAAKPKLRSVSKPAS